MRKNIFALSLILPLLFLFSVFSTAKTVALGVQISANGIELVDVPQNGYRIDISEKQEEIILRAKVLPEAATERGYFFRVAGDAVSVDEKGRLHAEKTGEAVVSAVSRDGGFEDSVKVTVYASAPYDLLFSLRDPVSGEELLSPTAEGYAAALPTGMYAFEARTVPGGAPAISSSGFALADNVAGTLFLPFGGRHTLELSADGQWKGEKRRLHKTVVLTAETYVTQSGFVVNGGNPVLVVERASRSASFFIEGEEPKIEACPEITASSVEALGGNRYRAQISFASAEDFSFFVTGESGEKREEVQLTFADFDFTVRAGLPVQTERPSILVGEPVSFYAVPAVPAEGVSYEWETEGNAAAEPRDGECVVTASEAGELALHVRAVRGGSVLAEKTLPVDAVRRVRTVQFADKTDLGLARCLVIGGKRFSGNELTENAYSLHPVPSDGKNELSGTEDIAFSVSEEEAAALTFEEGAPCLLPKGKGKVKVMAEWRGNGSYGEDVRSSLEVYVVSDGVEVRTSEELFRAADEGREIVLAADILLGTDGEGAPLSAEARAKLLREMPSTYNTEYYKNASGERPENAKVKYVFEFKNDVYGNGYELNAGLFTADRDGAAPGFFRGPLCFVRFGQLASVAAQDNISFLVRTDGVTLHNLSLLGCGDELLQTENGYDLSKLNTVGTVLEVNADCSLLNCRLRNGRTVARVYGGNRDGNRYFAPRPAEEERIHVRMEGCRLSQGREFLLKLGANAAIRSTAGNAEPDLLGYSMEKEHGDDNFYRDCVFTDVVLKDSVLETSGLFCIGVESNFSGPLLAEGGSGGAFDGWAGTGGTSYASVLRLVGDVRLYDWKDISLIDSSTLIETELAELKLDIAAMLLFVASREPEKYGDLLEVDGDARFVHGGIAFYGGGKNYSVLQDGLVSSGLREYRVDLSVLGEAEGSTGYQGQILPSAAGTQAFRFFLYDAKGSRNRAAQQKEAQEGKKYECISPLSPFSSKKIEENSKFFA